MVAPYIDQLLSHRTGPFEFVDEDPVENRTSHEYLFHTAGTSRNYGESQWTKRVRAAFGRHSPDGRSPPPRLLRSAFVTELRSSPDCPKELLEACARHMKHGLDTQGSDVYDLTAHERQTRLAFEWTDAFALRHREKMGTESEQVAPELDDAPQLDEPAAPGPEPSPLLGASGRSTEDAPRSRRDAASQGVIDLILGATVADSQVYHRIQWQGWEGDWWQRSPTVPEVLADDDLYLNRAVWLGNDLPERCQRSLEPHTILGLAISPGTRWCYSPDGRVACRLDLANARCDGKATDWSLLSPSRVMFCDRVVDFEAAPALSQALAAWDKDSGKVYPSMESSLAVVAAMPVDIFQGDPRATAARITELLRHDTLPAPAQEELKLLCRSLAKLFLPGGLVHDCLAVLGD